MPESTDTRNLPGFQLTQPGGLGDGNLQPTMSSREIADLTGKDHDNVRRDIRNLAKALSLTFEEKSEASTGGRPTVAYLLPKRETLILVSGYNVQMRAAIIDRWQELESAQRTAPAELSRMDLIRLAYDAETEREAERTLRLQYQQQVEEAAPKVAFADQVAAAEDAITTGEAAKLLGTGRTRLMEFLRKIGWVNRSNEPYQSKIEAGLLNVKVTNWEHPRDGLRKRVTPLVTGKGLARLHQLYAPAMA